MCISSTICRTQHLSLEYPFPFYNVHAMDNVTRCLGKLRSINVLPTFAFYGHNSCIFCLSILLKATRNGATSHSFVLAF